MNRRCLRMTAPRTKVAGECKTVHPLPGDRAGARSHASPTGWKLARRFGRHAALRSNVDWPLRYVHYWHALASSPQSLSEALPVLPTFSAQVRTRTGRIRSVLPTWTAPFSFRLNVSFIGSRTPSAPAQG